MFLTKFKSFILPMVVILFLFIFTADCYSKKIRNHGLFSMGDQTEEVLYEEREMIIPKDKDPFSLARKYRGKESRHDTSGYLVESKPKKVGHIEQFTVTNLRDASMYEVEAELMHISDNAYWYLDVRLPRDSGLFLKVGTVFDEDIYPAMSELFGDFPGDSKIAVLNTPLEGAAGYFSSADSYPRWVHPSSNERDIIFMDPRKIPIGTGRYLAVLAHEYQHAIHNKYDPGEESWVNEGLSELGVKLLNLESSFQQYHLRKPDTQLNFWSSDPTESLHDYAASASFFNFMINENDATSTLSKLVSEQEDGVRGLNKWLARYDSSFDQEFTKWILDNYRYGPKEISGPEYRKNVRHEVPQYATKYFDLEQFRGKTISFIGEKWVQRFKAKCPEICWWSNTGDYINTTLTFNVDLTNVKKPTAKFKMWHDIEEDWDYLYFAVSVDQGITWTTLEEATITTNYNPSGSNYGNAYTGKSDWSVHDVELTKYSGQEVLVRFEYVTDDAVNLEGVLIDGFQIPEAGLSLNVLSKEWNPEGFVLVNNVLPQKFIVRLVEFRFDGTNTIREVILDENNNGSIDVLKKGNNVKKVGLVVAGATLGTYQPAGFNLIYPD